MNSKTNVLFFKSSFDSVLCVREENTLGSTPWLVDLCSAVNNTEKAKPTKGAVSEERNSSLTCVA